ncbi:hypothetical protein [Streptomyces coeruleorubidus]|uniref:Uncharacterized protein n=1 Tax=Streptomyces coeruleorubidus TaxID=116188 RepID=A0A5J6I3I0_STRC4|nr:hypothetical protein [Streptomyces coeruleorubidus]QEV23657.1 hypothetical protein CP976_05495 [Streptomyces coeruleorubidus]GGU00849.1 hypothetical protein GCM10010256_71160 [Streptomyces coeruleorubidus]
MSESTAEGRAEPDFLDRLLARHAAPVAQRPGVVRVRPRLAGPFERTEAVRGAAPDPDGAEPLWPVAAPAAVTRPDRARPAAREVVRTERERTVVRTERAPAPAETGPRPAPPAEPEGPLLRPVTPTGPALRPVPDAVRRAAGRGPTERAATANAASVPTPPGTDAAPPAAVSAALLPSAADTAAARDAVRQAAARRTGRQAEQVVQVQIGRLEVTAGGTPQGGGGRPRPRDAERPRAAVSLADYLARGRE